MITGHAIAHDQHHGIRLFRRAPAPALEWRLLDEQDDAAWRAILAQPEPPAIPPTPSRYWRRAWVGAVCLLFLVALALAVDCWATQADAKLVHELELAVEADAWRGVEPQLSGATAAIDGIDLHGDQAIVSLVQIAGKPGTAAVAYRQTQAYAWSGEEWQRIAPSPALWGDARRLETAHLIIDYYARDHDAVVAAAPRLEQLYHKITSAYPIARPRHKFTIAARPDTAPKLPVGRLDPEHVLFTASPSVYRTPGALLPSDMLAQSVALALINEQARAYVDRQLQPRLPDDDAQTDPAAWKALAYGVQVWQVLDLDPDLPLAAWRIPLVHWLLQERLSDPNGPLPEWADSFCQTAELWSFAPTSSHIPLWCATGASVEYRQFDLLYSAWRQLRATPLSLGNLLPYHYSPTGGESLILFAGKSNTIVGDSLPPHPAASVTLATVIDYAAHTYGATTIPQLLAQAPAHDGWDTLIPAVFGVTAAEFEAGWHAFLAQEYGVYVAGDAISDD